MTHPFNHLFGNKQVKQYLMKMVEKGSIGNSLLFSGPESIGKGLFALALADHLLGVDKATSKKNHPDIHIYRPEGKLGMHSMDTMRRFHDEVYMTPYEGAWKVFIIHDAERMLPYSANALLKTFEEPAEDSLIILLSSSPENILSTVLSRCRRIYFQPLSDEEVYHSLQQHGIVEDKARQAALQARGSIGYALRLAVEGHDVAQDLLLKQLSQGKLNTYSELKKVAGEISDHLEKCKQSLEKLAREELQKSFPQDLSAVQKEILEKEVEGVVSVRFLNEVDALFVTLLSWFRDLQLLKVGGNSKHLQYRDRYKDLQLAAKRGEARSLEKVHQAIREARLGVQRFLPLSSCFESLFLKLDFL